METGCQSKNMKCCPIDTALTHLGKKWSINIIRDLFMGKKRFSDFLEANPSLSTKVLSTRLKSLQDEGLVEKNVVKTTPLMVEYGLTERGQNLNKIVYELAAFSITQYPREIFVKNPQKKQKILAHLKKVFRVE